MKKIIISLVGFLAAIQALAQSLEDKVQALADEIAQIKQQMQQPSAELTQVYGLGAGASKVYLSNQALSIGGYGEIVYRNPISGTPQTDAYRLVPYIGYRFSDDLIFNSEIEFEHGGAAGTQGVAIIEFAYLDFLMSPYFSVRAGHVLVPLGLINQWHEPIYFPTVDRPEVEKYLVPSTWHENGLLAYGQAKGWSYLLGAVNGLDASSFSSSSWIRGGRQKGAQADAQDIAAVARLEYSFGSDAVVGASVYTGNSSQGNAALGNSHLDLASLHFAGSWNQWDVKGLYVQGELSDTKDIQAASGQTLGETANGYYLIVSHDIWPYFSQSTKSLPLFAMYESYDLHASVAEGLTKDDSLAKTNMVFGWNYKPHTNVVVKWDYETMETGAGQRNHAWNMGLGFVF